MPPHLPRHLDGAPPSARVHNIAAMELDALTRSITVRRVRSALAVEGGVYPNIENMIPWETVAGGVNRGNWNSAVSPRIRITESGTYLMLLQVRFKQGGAGQGALQQTGRRFVRILLNGTSPVSNTIGQNVIPGSNPFLTSTTDVTVQAMACRSLQAGDNLWCSFLSTHVGPANAPNTGIDAMLGDWGGTYFTVSRIGPGAGTLTPDVGGGGNTPRVESRSLPPADAFNFVAQAIDNLGVVAKPRRTAAIALAAGVQQTLSWQADGVDTRGDMWDPADPTKLVVRISGTYLVELQVRFPPAGGAAYDDKWCTLYKNGTAPTDALIRDLRWNDGTYEGSTRLARAILRLVAGDVLYGAAGSSTAAVGASTDLGGTYLFAARIGRTGEGGTLLEGLSFEADPPDPESLRATAIASFVDESPRTPLGSVVDR